MSSDTAKEDIKEKLHGRWIIERMSTTFPDGVEEEHPGASGQLVYNTRLATVFAQIARKDSKDPSGKMAFSYYGNILFPEESKNEVVHCIISASKTDMVGENMRRTFNLSADGQHLRITGASAKYKEAMINIDWIKEDDRARMNDLPTGRRSRHGEEMNIT
ncbi:MAG: hypothetical protein CO093_10515 [Alphaproteobacteria bacterium CG_4_9_14_3_um_filter_47_13]|nr:MAG: hypothetical protein CO093_10515 [Alphaproteobacteria bacterium CG_4_9_14_3_um_filter_47_13]